VDEGSRTEAERTRDGPSKVGSMNEISYQYLLNSGAQRVKTHR